MCVPAKSPKIWKHYQRISTQVSIKIEWRSILSDWGAIFPVPGLGPRLFEDMAEESPQDNY